MINVLHSKYADQLKIRISDMQKETFEVEYEYEGERLDKYVSILFPEQSRSFFQKLIKDGNCLLYTSPSPRDGLLSRMPSSA